MKNLFNYLTIAAFAVIFIGMIWAACESNSTFQQIKEQKRVEEILKERRNKIDSLKITDFQNSNEYVQE